MAGPLLRLDADQQISAIDRNSPQNDRWHTEEIVPRRGPAYTLLLISDGDGSPAAGAIAELVVQIAFAEARLRRDEPFPRLFKFLVNQMNQVVFRQGSGDLVGFTLAAIRGNSIWLLQGGHQTRCYKVRGEKPAVALTTDNDNVLGKSETASPAAPLQYGLKKGDRLVFCTDGLFANSLVAPTDISRINRYDDIKGAARHLSALAMGRNVGDNVTVIVVGYGRRRLSSRNLVFQGLGVLLAVLIVAGLAAAMLRVFRVLPRPPDLGIAVVAEGSAVQVEQLQIIYPQSDINASQDSPVQIKLKRREAPKSSITQSITNVSLFLGNGTYANLAGIDIQGFIDPRFGVTKLTNLTEIRLYSGKALIVNKDDRTFYVWPGWADQTPAPLIVLQDNTSAIGIDVQEERVNAYCLRGQCSLYLGNSQTTFESGSKVSFSTHQQSVRDLVPTPIEDPDRSNWLALCSTWEADPEMVSAACQMLLP